MPTVVCAITDINDMAQEVNAAGDVQVNFGSVSNNVDLLNQEWFALRFLNVAVPQGAKLLDVRFSITVNNGTLDEPFHNWFAQATDNAPAFTAGAANFDISSRARTTAVSLWDVPDLGVGSIATRFQVPGMLPVVQEVINRAGWASGNAIVLIVTPASADSTRDLVFTTVITPNFVPVLEIEYELPGFISAALPGSPSLTRAIEQSSDDAHQTSGGSTFTASSPSTNLDGTDRFVGYRFQGVTIPRGATITSAILSVVAHNSTRDNPDCTVYGQATDNAPTFTTNNNDIGGRTPTTATVSWSSTDLGAPGTFSLPDLSAIIQEIVNRAGWNPGNALVIIIQGAADPARDLELEQFDSGVVADRASLSVAYTQNSVLQRF